MKKTRKIVALLAVFVLLFTLGITSASAAEKYDIGGTPENGGSFTLTTSCTNPASPNFTYNNGTRVSFNVTMDSITVTAYSNLHTGEASSSRSNSTYAAVGDFNSSKPSDVWSKVTYSSTTYGSSSKTSQVYGWFA